MNAGSIKKPPRCKAEGAKIITFTGNEEFLDSLHFFPSNFPFSIKIANAYIRGGDQVKERYAGGKSQRPRILQGALRDLLKRNSNMMADAAAKAEDRLADDLRRTDLHGNATNNPEIKLTKPLPIQATIQPIKSILTSPPSLKIQDVPHNLGGTTRRSRPDIEPSPNNLLLPAARCLQEPNPIPEPIRDGHQSVVTD